MKTTDLLNIPNFRVALYSSRPDRKPMVFRSSRLDGLSTEKLQSLKTHYGLKTILDLRSSREVDLSPRSSINSVFTPRVLKPSNASKLLRLKEADNRSFLQPDDRFILSLIGGRAIFALLGKLPNFLWKILAFFCLLTDAIFRTKFLTRIIIPRILNPMTLEGFNYFLLDNSKTEIGIALRVFKDEARFPIVVNCAQGKDRTGLVVALVQLVCGMDHEDIVQNYALSYEQLKGTQLISEIGNFYKLTADFESSNEETMRHIIDYIINKYTSVAQYLEQCGLSAADQSVIRRNIESGGAAILYDSQAGEVEGVQSQAVSIEVERFQQGVTSEKNAASQKVNLQVMRPASSFLVSDGSDRQGESVADVELNSNAAAISQSNANDVKDSQKLLEPNDGKDKPSTQKAEHVELSSTSIGQESVEVLIETGQQHQDNAATSESHT